MPVDLSSRRAATARVVLDARVQTLATVKVTEKRSRRARDLDGFEQRRAQGWGHYLTADDIERTRPTSVTTLLRSQPGLHVVPTGGNGYAIRGRGDCRPNVVIDGFPIADAADNLDEMVRPDAVAGIEVYSGQAGTPVEYGSNGCGTVLVWTKR